MAAEQAGATFVMVSDSAALEAVTGGPDGLRAGLSPGKLLIDMSTGRAEKDFAAVFHLLAQLSGVPA